MKIPEELINEYIELKEFRYKCMSEENYRYAFCFQVLIYQLCSNLPLEYYDSIAVSDHYKISRLIYLKAFEKNDDKSFDILFDDILSALNSKKVKTRLFKKKYINRASLYQLGVHIDIANSLYIIKPAIATIYVKNILDIYEKYYGNNGHSYLKLAIHMIEEVLCDRDVDMAIMLYQKNNHFFQTVLKRYKFRYNMLIKVSQTLLKAQRYEEALNMYDEIKRSCTEIDATSQQCNDMEYACEYIRGIILFNMGKYDELISEFKKVIYTMQETNALYAAYCLEIANGYIALNEFRQARAWVKKGLFICLKLEQYDDVYYKLERLNAYFKLKIGDKKGAIESIQLALDGIKKLYGKQNENYILCLCDLTLYVDDERASKKYWQELSNLSDLIEDPYYKAVILNNFVSKNVNMQNEYTVDYKNLSLIAKKALDISNNIKNENIQILSRLNYTRCLIEQLDDRNELHKIITDNFNYLEKYYKNKNDIKTDDYFMYCLCRLLYSHAIGNKEKVRELNEYIEKQVLPTMSNNFKKLFKEFKYNLDFRWFIKYKDYEQAIILLDKKIKKCLNNILECKDISDCLEYIDYYISFVSQYGTTQESYTESIYNYVLISKYLRAQFYGDFLDASQNYEIGRELTALETRKLFKKVYGEDEKEDLEKRIEKIHDYINQSSNILNETIRIPKLDDINIPQEGVLLEYYRYIEIDHTTNSVKSKKLIKNDKFAVFLILPNFEGKRLYIKRFPDIDAVFLFKEINALYDERGQIEQIDKNIYNAMFLSVKKYIQNYDYIYISSDSFLTELPMEMFIDIENSMLCDHIIVHVASALDVMPDFKISFNKQIIMGNPEYNIRKLHTDFYQELHVSEIEVNIISQMLNVEAFVGKYANKGNFLSNVDCSLIYISSHGGIKDIDSNKFYMPLISSFILLAGVEDWQDNSSQEECGNGILTAQEVAFLDLHNTDLVILSACNSGCGYTDGIDSPRGLRWALSYAGVKANITCLPIINARYSAIFVILLFRNLLKFPVAHALWVTKIEGMELTVADILADNELSQIYNYNNNSKYSMQDTPLVEEGVIYQFECRFNGGKLWTKN